MPETSPNTVKLSLVRVDQITAWPGLEAGSLVEGYAVTNTGEPRWIVTDPEPLAGVWLKDKDVRVWLPNFKGSSVLQILHLHRCYFASLVTLPAQVAAREIERLDKAAEAGLVAAVNEGLYRQCAAP